MKEAIAVWTFNISVRLREYAPNLTARGVDLVSYADPGKLH